MNMDSWMARSKGPDCFVCTYFGGHRKEQVGSFISSGDGYHCPESESKYFMQENSTVGNINPK
jgi:hypothetical protein